MAGAFVLDALDGRDRDRFGRHLARCPECRRETGGLLEVTARLAAAAATPPSAGVKERVLAEIGRTRQLPPATAGLRRRRARHLIAGPERPGWARAPRLALVLALACTLAAAAVWAASGGRSPAAQQPPGAGAIAAVLTAPDATMISAPVRTGGAATVVMSDRERTLVFAAAGLRALPASRCYELWLVSRGRDRPAGLLPMPAHDGMTGPVIAAGLEAGDRLGLSVEPGHGTRRPTSQMIMIVTL